MARGEKFIRETPCKKCGGVEFYVVSRLCCVCSRAAASAQYIAKKQPSSAQGVPPEFAREANKAKQAQALRLAEKRAQLTARQRACAYGVPI